MSTTNALPIAVYHKATLQGKLVSDEECVADTDVFANGDEEYIGVPLVRLSDALAAIAAASAVQPGYAIVPIEPTREMIAALFWEGDLGMMIGHYEIAQEGYADYANMLAAAPQPLSAAMPTEWLALDKLNEALGVQGDATMAMLLASVRINRLQSELAASPRPPAAVTPISAADLAHVWETIYDHGAGKHKGAVSLAQRQKAIEILERMEQPPSAAMQPLADEVHSCSFFCNLPDCIKTQRDLLRDQITKAAK